MTTYIVYDAITGHPIGLASQSLLQAHLKLKEAVHESDPVLIASVQSSGILDGIIDIYEPDRSSGHQQWPRRRAVQLRELPELCFEYVPWSGPDSVTTQEARGFPVQFESAAEVPITPSTHWSWPSLPTGHSYLNPENLTVEQLGDGWRPLCTLDERYPGDHQYRSVGSWRPGAPCSEKPTAEDGNFTYRTRAPIPTLPYNP